MMSRWYHLLYYNIKWVNWQMGKHWLTWVNMSNLWVWLWLWISARMETVTDRDTPNRRQTRGVDILLSS